MEPFFHRTVANWEDWGRVYQDMAAFTPLLREIYRREGLPFAAPEGLTSGTNAVFRVGDTVAKVFFPRESGLDPFPDFSNEAAVCGRLEELGVSTPRLLAKGRVDDKYQFYYIITEYFRGKEAGDWLAGASAEEKRRFAAAMRDVLSRLNRPAQGLILPADLRGRASENPRLQTLPPLLAADLRERAGRADLSRRVLVHGDLTGENVLIGGAGEPVLIDCADACLAPAWYEYGPLVFELFRCDPVLLRAFAGEDREGFVESVLDAVCLHNFGADLLREAARREKRELFPRLADVKSFLREKLDAPGSDTVFAG